MRGKMLIAIAVYGAAAMPTAAAISVLGAGHGQLCYEAAAYNRPLNAALRDCGMALEDEALSANDRAATLVNRGIVQMQAKNFSAAIVDYDAAIRMRPETAEAYVNKGIALLHLGGRDAEAVAVLSEGLSRNPSRPEVAYYSRGVAYEMVGDNRQAFEDYSKAAELAPGWSDPATQLQRFKVLHGVKTGQGA